MMERYRKTYDIMMAFQKWSPVTVVFPLVLYVLSVFMANRSEVGTIHYIRDFSFAVFFLSVIGVVYLKLFTKNMKANLDYTREDPGPFLSNVKYASIGIGVCVLMVVVSIVWIVTLIVKYR